MRALVLMLNQKLFYSSYFDLACYVFELNCRRSAFL